MFEGAEVVLGERYGFSDTLFTFFEQTLQSQRSYNYIATMFAFD
jgi:hypothetical protein